MRRLTALCLALALYATPVRAQVIDSGFINAGTACTTTGACVAFVLGQATSINVQIVGTFSATLTFEGTSDGATWVSVQAVNVADGSSASTTTAAGTFAIANSGFQQIRVRASSYASGGAQVTAVRGYGVARWLSPFLSGATFTKDGIGTTSTTSVLIRNTTAAAAGAQQYSPRACWEGQGWKTDATAASQSVRFCQETQPVQGAAAPTGNFVLSASINGGAFSTVSTYTSGGQWLAPNGTAALPSLSFAGDATKGWYSDAANVVRLAIQGVRIASFTASGLSLLGNGFTLDIGAAGDASIGRGAASTITVGTSTTGVRLNASVDGTLTVQNFAGSAGAHVSSLRVQTTTVAVSALPTCNAAMSGARASVNDANATTFLSTVAAGGANVVPVFCNGTNWVIG